MNSDILIPVLLFLVPYVAYRHLSALAIGTLPDEKKLELVNVAVKGRTFLWLWLLPIAIVFIWFREVFFPIAALVLLTMVTFNHWWVRNHDYPQSYVRRHLYATLLAVFSFLAPMLYVFGRHFIAA